MIMVPGIQSTPLTGILHTVLSTITAPKESVIKLLKILQDPLILMHLSGCFVARVLIVN